MAAVRKLEVMPSHPIPDEALDDRLAFVGTAGSGKTYNAGTAVERLLLSDARVVIPDPLGVWHGLRLKADGKSPAFPVVIFGGAHGDLPLTEQAGALIGETAATMAESCIVDLSGLGTKAAERRFMLAFLTALYRKTPGDPMHVVFDEADMWAPQMLSDKEGDAAKLLGIMETIVRRGRIKGFIPWLITQRPAVLSKNVLSQADGLVAMKLTSSQDRAALGDWIEGQADRAEGKRILGEMPGLQRGQGVVWIPGRGILETRLFPAKKTFDSSRTPARGETKRTLTLKPLDIDALKGKLAKVEDEIKANDPRALKAELTALKKQMAAGVAAGIQGKPDPAAIEKARQQGYADGAASRDADVIEAQERGRAETLEALQAALGKLQLNLPKIAAPPKRAVIAPPPTVSRAPVSRPSAQHTERKPPPDGVTGPQMRIIEALAFWRGLDFETPTRAQLGAVAGYSPSSGGFNNLLGQLRSMGFVDYPAGGVVTLTNEGLSIAPEPSNAPVRERLGRVLSNPQAKIIDALPEDGEAISRDELGQATGYSASSGGFNNLLGQLRTLGLITYPSPGFVAVEPWVFQ